MRPILLTYREHDLSFKEWQTMNSLQQGRRPPGACEWIALAKPLMMWYCLAALENLHPNWSNPTPSHDWYLGIRVTSRNCWYHYAVWPEVREMHVSAWSSFGYVPTGLVWARKIFLYSGAERHGTIPAINLVRATVLPTSIRNVTGKHWPAWILSWGGMILRAGVRSECHRNFWEKFDSITVTRLSSSIEGTTVLFRSILILAHRCGSNIRF